jgi:hypothetical protein
MHHPKVLSKTALDGLGDLNEPYAIGESLKNQA